MVRQYVTPAEVLEAPLGIALSSSLSQLATGVLDKLTFRASQRCDRFCQKRLQAPGSSTLSSNVSSGATSIAVASTLTLDNLSEQAVIIGSGSTQETVLIQPGGITLTSVASPYPGTITLATGLQFGHSSGETVQYCYKEVSEAGSSSSSDPYTESLQTQAMQLALAHLPPARTALTRVVFTKNYPLIQIYNIEHAFSFVNQFNQVDLSIETVMPNEGWYRFNVGTVVLREGVMRTTYTAGYQAVPDDIKEAALCFLKDLLVPFVNPYGATSQTLGHQSRSFRSGQLSNNAQEAEVLLEHYRRLV